MKFVYNGVRHEGVLSDKDMSIKIDGKNIAINAIERIEMTPQELDDLIASLTSNENEPKQETYETQVKKQKKK